MATLLESLDLPKSKDVATRLAWATERQWDLAEGKLTRATGGLLWAVLVGWGDLATEDERRQYFAVARVIQQMLEDLIDE